MTTIRPGLTVTKNDAGKPRLQWQANPEPDLYYYRIYRAAKREVPVSVKTHIALTIATSFVDVTAKPGKDYTYKVVAVDQSGNAGP